MQLTQSKVAASTSELQTDDMAFLGTLAAKGNTMWRSVVNLAGTNVNFKLDMGAEVIAAREHI